MAAHVYPDGKESTGPMSEFQKYIDMLTQRGFYEGMTSHDGQFLHKEVDDTDEICIHLTTKTFPANKPGANIWLQDPRNARPKFREDVLIGSHADFERELLDRIVGFEVVKAKSTLEAVCRIHKRMGVMYGTMEHKAFPAHDPAPHRLHDRVKDYMDASRLANALDSNARVDGATMPDLKRVVTPGKVSRLTDFSPPHQVPGFAERKKKINDGAFELTVAHLEFFDGVVPSDATPSEGHYVVLYDEADEKVAFRHHLEPTEDVALDQERAYLIAAAVEASRKSFVADGAEFLADYFTSEHASVAAAEMAFDLVREDRFEDLGEGDDELLWVEFADELHERIHGFSYDMESVLAPAMNAPSFAEW